MAGEDLEKLLRKNLEVSEHSLEILKKIHREAVLRRVFTALKWIVIIGLLVWGFLQIQPFIDDFLTSWNRIIDFYNRFAPGQ